MLDPQALVIDLSDARKAKFQDLVLNFFATHTLPRTEKIHFLDGAGRVSHSNAGGRKEITSGDAEDALATDKQSLGPGDTKLTICEPLGLGEGTLVVANHYRQSVMGKSKPTL